MSLINSAYQLFNLSTILQQVAYPKQICFFGFTFLGKTEGNYAKIMLARYYFVIKIKR
jgi:hypothetical protein